MKCSNIRILKIFILGIADSQQFLLDSAFYVTNIRYVNTTASWGRSLEKLKTGAFQLNVQRTFTFPPLDCELLNLTVCIFQ